MFVFAVRESDLRPTFHPPVTDSFGPASFYPDNESPFKALAFLQAFIFFQGEFLATPST